MVELAAFLIVLWLIPCVIMAVCQLLYYGCASICHTIGWIFGIFKGLFTLPPSEPGTQCRYCERIRNKKP